MNEDRTRYGSLPKIQSNIGAALTANRQAKFGMSNPLADGLCGRVNQNRHELDVPLEETWSYWEDGVRQCGVCLGCLARKEGFRDPGIVDPTRYVDNSPYTGIPSR